jgi:hypothetical protein
MEGPTGEGPTGRRRLPRARWQRLALAAAALALAVAVVLLLSDGGSSSPRVTPEMAAQTRRIDTLLDGIPHGATTLGDPSAPVTLQYFADMVCPPTREFTLGPFASIIREWVRPGKLRIEWRSMQEGTEPEEVFVHQQQAALAAGLQGKLWYFLEYFYEEQARHQVNENDSCFVPESLSLLVARQVPSLNLGRWKKDRHDQRLASKIVEDERAATSERFDSAPSFLIGRTGADQTTKLYFAWAEPTIFEKAFGQALEKLLPR